MLEPQALKAHAKVNLSLSVAYPPADSGLHGVESVFQEIALCDDLAFSVIATGEASLRCGDAASLPPCVITSMGTPVRLDCGPICDAVQDNLIFRAMQGMEERWGALPLEAGQEVLVQVAKRIPAGGGMGGGSSDAAAAMVAMARWLDVDPLCEGCLALARGLGADVAFFLYGGCALMEGKGDRLARRLPSLRLPLVLMGEERPCPTGSVYAAFDADPQPRCDARGLASLLEGGSASASQLADACGNNLQRASFACCPGLEERVAWAQGDPDVLTAMVSGSGSTSFALCVDVDAARRFAQRAAQRSAWVRIVGCR